MGNTTAGPLVTSWTRQQEVMPYIQKPKVHVVARRSSELIWSSGSPDDKLVRDWRYHQAKSDLDVPGLTEGLQEKAAVLKNARLFSSVNPELPKVFNQGMYLKLQ